MAIYILNEGKPVGPYSALEIAESLRSPNAPTEFEDEDGSLEPFSPVLKQFSNPLAVAEGMPFWRSVREALVWERSRILFPYKVQVEEIAMHQFRLGQDKRFACTELRKLFKSLNINLDMEAMDDLAAIIELNKKLLISLKHSEQDRRGTIGSALYPAMELVVLWDSHYGRKWQNVWLDSGGRLFDGKMIARNDDPIWLTMSDFGYPFPPYSQDYNTMTMAVENSKALALGIVRERERVPKLTSKKPYEVIGILEPS